MNAVLTILIGSIFVNNFAMSRFYGICPFLGVSKKLETAFGMGMAVTFVMALASFASYLVNTYLLIPFDLEYLQVIAFILVIAVLVGIVEMAIKKMSPSLYQALGVYLPLITTNCAVLGVTQLNVTEGYNLVLSVLNGVASAVGYTLAICLFAGIRERLEVGNLPKWMEGFPGAMIAAGLMAVAFNGFSGLI
ncbi:MAG: electron transport complex subunit RsxA [Clostridia bacterium]|jgi:electron transport complex protein RnfA|nr:electron transport complex subunit RsxA [Clostridia bacterium]